MRALLPILWMMSLGCGFSLGSADLGEDEIAAGPKRTQSDLVEAGPSDDRTSSTNNVPDAGPSMPAKDASAPDAPPPGLRAFVTSKQTNGNLGGIAGADAFCSDVAKQAGLTGTFRAWISTPTMNAIDRMTASGPWVLSNGKAIANTKADLASGKLLDELDKDEKGDTPPIEDNRAWTATGPDGKYEGNDCGDWTTTGGDGRTGEAEFQDSRWTDSKVEYCNKLKRLYCFAQ